MEALGLVGPAPPWAGGIATFTTALAGALRERGPVDWLSWLPPQRGLPPGTHLEPVDGVPADADAALRLYDPSSWRDAGIRLRRCGAVVLSLSHPALLFPYRALVHAYRGAGRRVVLVCHNVVAHERTPGLQALARRVLDLADVLVVHSREEARLAHTLTRGRVLVREAFHPVYREHASRPWPPRPLAGRLLVFGYVKPYKGVEDVIAALPHVPAASLEVVGRFSRPVERYRRLARRHGLHDRARFVDAYVPEHELSRVFARSDLVVAPYRQASQSGVVHLAYSFGRPVVATAVGGLSDAVEDGATGLLVPPRDPRGLAAGIAEALAARPARFDAGIRRVLATRTWDRYADIVHEAATAPERSLR